MGKYQKIAIFRALQLGDMLCSVPALRALKKSLPDAQITLIGLPWAKEFVIRFSHYLSDFIPFPGYPGLPEQEFNTKKLIKFLKDVQKRKFDLCLQMQGDGSVVNPLVLLFGAGSTAGFYQRDGFCPDAKTFMPYPEKIPEINRHLKLMKFLGFPSLGEELEFPVTDKEKKEFEDFKNYPGLKEKKYVCIHPGARAKNRRWEIKKFAQVGNYFFRQGFKVVLTGSKDEKHITNKIFSMMSNQAINLSGKTGLGLLANLIKGCRLIVCSDTSVSHIADALNTPSVVIFRNSDPKRWAPKNQKLHRTVLKNQAKNYENVILEASSLLPEQNLAKPVTV